MTISPVRWLLDAGLPRSQTGWLDTVHAEDFPRVPGPCGIQEAFSLDRVLVTCDQEFRGSWSLPLEHPGIVVLEDCPADPRDVERNLEHFEFRLRQYDGVVQLTGNRFVIRSDREVLQVLPDGTEVDLAPWRLVRIADEPVRVAALG